MTRDQALAAMDALTGMGYSVSIGAAPVPRGFLDPRAASDGILYRVEVVELGVDKVDLRALVAAADELDMDCGIHGLIPGRIVFSDLDRTTDAVRNPRKHPLGDRS